MHSPAETCIDVCSFLYYQDLCSLQLTNRRLASIVSSNIDRLPLMTRYRLEVKQNGFGSCFLDLIDVKSGRIDYSLVGEGSEMSKWIPGIGRMCQRFGQHAIASIKWRLTSCYCPLSVIDELKASPMLKHVEEFTVNAAGFGGAERLGQFVGSMPMLKKLHLCGRYDADPFSVKALTRTSEFRRIPHILIGGQKGIVLTSDVWPELTNP